MVSSLLLLVFTLLISSSSPLQYVCGKSPTQYYSKIPCAESCENGGRALHIPCSNALECWAVEPFSDCIRYSCCTLPHGQIDDSTLSKTTLALVLPPITVAPRTHAVTSPLRNLGASNSCFGKRAESRCLNGLCGAGLRCSREGFCCECATGPSSGRCGRRRSCSVASHSCDEHTGRCCPPEHRDFVQACVDGLCPKGSRCSSVDSMCYGISPV